MIIKHREKEMLRQLVMAVKPIETEQFIKLFQISLRTCRYDLKNLRSYLKANDVNLLKKGKEGYYLLNQDKTRVMALLNQQSSLEANQRQEQLFLILLCHQPIPSTKLANLLYLSTSAALKLIANTQSAEIQIVKDKNGYRLCGNEWVIRTQACRIITQHFEQFYNVLDYYEILPSQLKTRITQDQYVKTVQAINTTNSRFKVWLSQQAFTYLLSYMLVLGLREKHPLDTVDPDDVSLANEAAYSSVLLQALYEEVQVTEVAGLVRVLSTLSVLVLPQSKANADYETVIDESLTQLMAKGVEMNYPALRTDLIRHLALSFRKAALQQTEDYNPLLTHIKKSYPSEFQLASTIAKHLQEKTGLQVDESETSYIAIYLYKNRLHKPEEHNTRIYVACAESRGVSELIATRIKHIFPQIEILGTLSIDQVLGGQYRKDIDFIVSTIPLITHETPIIHVSPLFNLKDIEMIQNTITFGTEGKTLITEVLHDNREFVHQRTRQQGSTLVKMESITKILLDLLDVLELLSLKYEISQERMMGLILHVVLAIPQWYRQENHKDQSQAQKILAEYQRLHPLVTHNMERVFNGIEEELGILLTPSDKISFMDYVVIRGAEDA
ncbi:MAG: PRD domain-containing protein [Erysipelotrichaceae bacterium]|nr:PRD domain-containing protein [Erysipelotrichaceae bacterium]